ncbi:MAG: tRNA lysidine(34) synthetase TilS [Flavobacteriales bacterium]|mgnify:FL=1|nr:tRNA lysidine(34) synthetase TilS [Flavobacteriales bacterium]
MNKIEKSYHNFFNENNIDINSKFLIAVSAGADSMACLAIAQNLNLKIEVAHVNFLLRGLESDNETILLRKYCEKHKIKIHVLKKDCNAYSISNKLSVQESARNIRYSFFEEIVSKHEIDYVITGHHSEDTIETFFINAIRGTGIKGLSGIPKVRGIYIRPLLDTSKKEIQTYISENDIPYLDDSSNASLKYDRNFLRNKITPLLKERFKNFNTSLKSTISIIESENKLLHQLVSEKLAPFISYKKESIHIENVENISSKIWYHFLKNFGFNAPQVDDIVNHNHQSGKKFSAPNHTLFVDRNKWIIHENKINVNQEYLIFSNLISETPFLIEAIKIKVPSKILEDRINAYLDYNLLSFPLKIRKWKKGDFFIPLGMENKKKVSDFLIDNKIPQSEKDEIWVLTNKGEIIWLMGYRISDSYKISDKTKHCLHLRIQ